MAAEVIKILDTVWSLFGSWSVVALGFDVATVKVCGPDVKVIVGKVTTAELPLAILPVQLKVENEPYQLCIRYLNLLEEQFRN